MSARAAPVDWLGPTITCFVLVSSVLYGLGRFMLSALPPAPPPPPDVVAQLLPSARWGLHPEPHESRTFAALVLCAPAISALLWVVIARTQTWRAWRWVTPVLTPLVALGAVYILVEAPISLEVFRYFVTEKALFAASLLGGGALAWLLVLRPSVKEPPWRLLIGVALAIAAFFYGWRVYPLGAVHEMNEHTNHLEAVLYAPSQAIVGRTALADFPTQYGLYGELLAPWFRVVGLSVLSFTLTMNALFMLGVFAVFYAMRRHARSGWIFMLGALAWIHYIQSFGIIAGPDSYFQYWPLRFVWPAVALALFSLWRERGDRRLFFGLSILSGVAVTWNLDSGVALIGSWLGYHFLRGAADLAMRGPWRASLRALAVATAISLATIALVVVAIRIAAGKPLDLSRAADYQKLFLGLGLHLMPMRPPPDFWLLVVGVYLAGVVVGMRALLRLNDDAPARDLLFVAMIGFGELSYFIGRSHDYNLVAVMWPLPVIAVALVARLLPVQKSWRALAPVAIACSVGVAIAISLTAMAPSAVTLFKERWFGPASIAMSQVELIKANVPAKSECLVIARHQAVLMAEAGIASAVSGPGLAEIGFVSDVERIMRAMEEGSASCLFIERDFFAGSPQLLDFSRGLRTLSQHFRLVAVDRSKTLAYFTRVR